MCRLSQTFSVFFWEKRGEISKKTQKNPKNLEKYANLTAADSLCVNEVKLEKKKKGGTSSGKFALTSAAGVYVFIFFFANTKEKYSKFSASGGILPHQKMTLAFTQ